MKRINYIDWIKGFGIILVVLNHILPSGDKLVSWMGTFHMPLFFVLSGMLLVLNDKWKNRSIKDNLVHKFKSLIIPYLKVIFILIIFLLILGIFLRDGSYFTKIVDIIKQTAFLEGYGPMWFIFALFFGECLFILFKKINNNEFTILIGTIIIVALYSFIPDLRNTGSNIIIRYLATIFFVFVRSCLACSFISIGYIFEKYLHKYVDYKVGIVLFIIHILVFARNGYIVVSNLDINNILLFYAIAICGVFAWILLIEKISIKPINNMLSFFGKNSFIILCTHESFMIVEFFKSFINQPLVILICVMILEYFIILIVNKYFNKFLFNK